MDLQPIPTCSHCGQQAAFEPSAAFPGFLKCEHCLGLERQPQGETVRLFEPAPAVMPGQTSF